MSARQNGSVLTVGDGLKSMRKTESVAAAGVALRRNLKKLRKERGLSMVVVSNGCCIHSDAYRRYESGDSLPKPQALLNIANYYDVTIDYLLGRDTERKRASAFCTTLTEKTGGKEQE